MSIPVQSKASRRALMIMFVFMLIGFMYLAFRSEVQIRDDAKRNHQECLARNVNMQKLNKFYDGMIKIEQNNPFVVTSPETIEQRIQLYRAVRLNPISCKK